MGICQGHILEFSNDNSENYDDEDDDIDDDQ